MRKRTVTTIQIAERIVVPKARSDLPRPACPVCAASAMVTPEEAAALARVTVRGIYARVEAGGVDFVETPDGSLFLCADSLSRRAGFDAPQKLIAATNPDEAPPTGKE